jgi:Lecithin retinol acyltransferase
MPSAHDSTQKVRRQGRRPRGLRPHVQAVDPGCEPPIGAHMLTPRRGYTHHGIYVGRGRVVHYGGLSRGLRRGPVEEVPLSQFARGRPIWVRPWDMSSANPEEVVRRARLRIGENRYRVLTNNCEHFCEWCISGDSRSCQVDALIAQCRGVWQRLASLVTRRPIIPRYRPIPSTNRFASTPLF